MEIAGTELQYRFEGWTALPQRNVLVAEPISEDAEVRRPKEVKITPKAMDVLVYLLDHAGQVVAKQELLDALWSGLAVTDDALVVTIYELRKALGDKARQPFYLETVARRGYRFKAGVERFEGRSTEPETSSESPVVSPRALLHPVGLALVFLLLSASAVTVLRFRSPQQIASTELAQNGIPDEELNQPDDPVVTALLSTGRRGLEKRRWESLEQAEQAYERLSELRPEDPRGYAGMARVASMRADMRLGDRFELFHRTRTLAERALSLDESVADAHLALSSAQLFSQWDLEGAGHSIERALGLAPTDPDVHQLRAWWLSASGDLQGATSVARHVVALQPANPTRRADLAFLLVLAGEIEEAIAVAEQTLELDPKNATACGALVRAHLSLGHENEAAGVALELFRLRRMSAETLAELERIQSGEGYWAMLSRVLDDLPPEIWLTTRAAVHAQRGETERALGFLEQAFQRRDWEILWLEHLQELAPLRTELRFKDLLSRRSRTPG